MTAQRAIVPSLCLILGACAGASGPSPDGGLAYAMPDPPTAQYVYSDSLEVSVNSPMGSMTVPQSSTATLDMTFAQGVGGLEINAAVADFEASMENPMQGSMSADEGDVSGTLTMTLDRVGNVEVTNLPSTSGAAADLASFLSLAQSMFPRLPGEALVAGEMWVDTVSWSGSDGPADVESDMIYTSTVVGDTVVSGRRLLALSVQGVGTLMINASQQGAQLEQELEVESRGTVLWDPEARMLVSSDTERDFEGVLTLVGMNMPPMSVSGSGPVRVRLVP